MRRITLAQATEEVEVAILDRVYNLRPITRSVEERLDDLDAANKVKWGEEREVTQLSGGELVEFLGPVLDILLKPAAGGRTVASKALADAWEGNKIDKGQLLGFYVDLATGGPDTVAAPESNGRAAEAVPDPS